jgi:anaerobic magnesium-protoporphyrin IX monomethyl ester cyclase
MLDVLLTHSYHLPYDQKQVRKMQPYRPLGTLYAASALRAHGFSVALFDTMLSNPEEEFAAFFENHDPRIVVIYEDDFNFLTKMCLTRMREVVWHIARVARSRAIPVIVHGSDATDHPELFLQQGVDYVLRGEAEQTLVTLCHAILSRIPFPAIDGLVHAGDMDKSHFPSEVLSKNPDWIALPQPPMDLTDFAPYRTAWQQAHGYFSVNMVASRGCPYRCNWCAKPISGNKFHLRAPSEVAEEMLQLKVKAGAEHVWFSDDVFALNRRWVQDFAEEVAHRSAALPFKIQSRADLMTHETIAALRSAGCTEVWMGVESGSQRILDAMDKGLRLSAVREARQHLQSAGIRACYFLQFGYPGETWEDLQETISFVRSTRPDDIGISFSYPLPGTVFYERVQAQLGPKRNWSDSDDLCIMFEAEYTSEFYRAVRTALHAEVDTWTATADTASQVDQLWHEVSALEPVCRNANALRFSEPLTGSAALPNDFISIHQLTGTTGA